MDINDLSFQAIYSDEERDRLLSEWESLQRDLTRYRLSDHERRLLAAVSRNDEVLARVMCSVESFMDGIVAEARASVTQGKRIIATKDRWETPFIY